MAHAQRTTESSNGQHAPMTMRSSVETALCYRELLDLVTRLYELTGQYELKAIIDRANEHAPRS